jgi:hypothetical protein
MTRPSLQEYSQEKAVLGSLNLMTVAAHITTTYSALMRCTTKDKGPIDEVGSLRFKRLMAL